jgi:ubiquinone/menaquinone biosynthesis C-methylase UbiE
MERRTDAVELLDGPSGRPGHADRQSARPATGESLAGGVRLSADAINALAAHRQELTLPDVGMGGADIPIALLARAKARGRGLTVVGLDSRLEVLAAAGLANPAAVTTVGLQLQLGDGRSLPYPDRSFEVAHASLILHISR